MSASAISFKTLLHVGIGELMSILEERLGIFSETKWPSPSWWFIFLVT